MMTSDRPQKSAVSTPQSRDEVRAISDLEAKFFVENGWVLLRQLVSAELCGAILDRARPRLVGLMKGTEDDFATPEEKRKFMSASASEQGAVIDNKKWIGWYHPVRRGRDPVLARAALSPTMGRNAQRMLMRDKPVRIYHDIFMCKLPDAISTHSGWHQDSPNFPIDRNALTIWIALDEITPDQGSLQFYSGSHRRGLLGKIAPDPNIDLVDEYPELAELPVSPPPHLQPGDATVHHGLTVHGAGMNNTPRPRWSFAVCYMPTDARYTGAPSHDCDGFDLAIGEPIDHPSFSLVPI
jgi:hypothetical protein